MYSRFTGFFCKGDEGRSERGWTKCEGSGGCTIFFFFFFLNFGLTQPFRPIQADTDRVGPILAASAPISAQSAPISAASARFGTCHVARRGPTRHERAVCGVPAASPRPAASDAGALAWEPRPCIPDNKSKFTWILTSQALRFHVSEEFTITLAIIHCNKHKL